ncbi:MAG: hypothetical protein R2778_13535 [Saprospiraceae bacterium]
MGCSRGMTIYDVHNDIAALTSGEDPTQENKPGFIVVCNKMDKNPLFDTNWLLDPTQPGIHPYLLEPEKESKLNIHHSPFTINHSALLPVSAKNEMNIEALKDKLFELVAGDQATALSSSGGATIVSNLRHHDALRRADAALEDVLNALDSGISGDFIAQDIRRALSYLGEISGEIGVEDLLGNIFGKFCIGK